MTATTTITTSGPFSSAASSFITLVGKKDEVQSAQPLEKTIEKPTFVLNSSHFVMLQAYVHAGIKAPANEALFESEFPKDAFQKYLNVDTTLYEGLKTQLVLTHNNCANFQGGVVAPMITTGGLVADFGEYLKTAVAEILAAVNVLIDPKITSKNPEFDDAKDTVLSACRKIKRRAEDVKSNCDKLIMDLGDFRTQTESDKRSLTELNERFDKVMPSKAEQDSELRKLIQKANDFRDAAHKTLQDTEQEIKDTEGPKWTYFIPSVGVYFVIYNVVRHRQLMEKMNELKKNYEDAQAKGDADLVKLVRVYNIINHLDGEIDGILDTIDNARDSVQAMSTAFSTLSTDFSKVREYIRDVEGDIDESSLKERGFATKDLAKAVKIWEQVEVLGRHFQLNGGLLEADPANPPQIQ